MTVSGSEEDVAGASPFHPRYNTPVSQSNDITDAVDRYVFNNGDVELGLGPHDAADAKTTRTSFCCRDSDGAMKGPSVVEMASPTSFTPRSKCIEFETWPCGRLVNPLVTRVKCLN